MIKRIRIYNRNTNEDLIKQEFSKINIIHSCDIENELEFNSRGKTMIFHAFSYLFLSESFAKESFIIKKSNYILEENKDRDIQEKYIDNNYIIELTSHNGNVARKGFAMKNGEIIPSKLFINDKVVEKNEITNKMISSFYESWPKFRGLLNFNKNKHTFKNSKTEFVNYLDYANFWFKLQEGDEKVIRKAPFQFFRVNNWINMSIENSSIINSLLDVCDFRNFNDLVNIREKTKNLKQKSESYKTISKKKTLKKYNDNIDENILEKMRSLSNEINNLAQLMKKNIMENPDSLINGTTNNFDKANKIDRFNISREIDEKISEYNSLIKDIKIRSGDDVAFSILLDIHNDSIKEEKKKIDTEISETWNEFSNEVDEFKSQSIKYWEMFSKSTNDGSEYNENFLSITKKIFEARGRKIDVPLIIIDDFASSSNDKVVDNVAKQMVEIEKYVNYEQIFITTSTIKDLEPLVEAFDNNEIKYSNIYMPNWDFDKNR